jgi:pimeloyl-ACP methyl ester carboxylesterase
VRDLERLRQALGAERWVIAGVSYGTYVAERYALRHPDRVRGLVLDSVVRQDGVDLLQRTNLVASARVLRAVCAAQECEGDPVADLEQVVGATRDGGVAIFDAIVGLSIGVPRLEEVPPALREAAEGRPARLQGLVAGVREASEAPTERFSAGLHAATLCAESRAPWDGPLTPPADREQALAVARERLADDDLGPFDARTATGNGLVDTCRRWPPQPPPPARSGRPCRRSRAPAGRAARPVDAAGGRARPGRADAAAHARRGARHGPLDAPARPTGCAVGALERFLQRRPIGRCRPGAGRRPVGPVAARRSAPGGRDEPAGVGHGLVAGGHLAGEARLGDLGEQLPQPRAAADAELVGELVAADERLLGGAALARQGPRQDRADHVEVRGDRRAGVVAPRGQAVGHRQQRHVGGQRVGGHEVAVDRPAREGALVDEEAQVQVVAGQRGDVGAHRRAAREPALV